MTVYLDSVFALNFAVNWLLRSAQPTPWRCICRGAEFWRAGLASWP